MLRSPNSSISPSTAMRRDAVDVLSSCERVFSRRRVRVWLSSMTVTPPASLTISPRREAFGADAAPVRAIVASGTSKLDGDGRRRQHVRQVSAANERRHQIERAARRGRLRAHPIDATGVYRPRARTSASRSIPKVLVRPANAGTHATMRSSSAFATSSVDALAPSKISALASAIASTDAKKPMCASPTFVQTRTSGFRRADQRPDFTRVIHPELDDTATSGRFRSSINDSGSPM